MSCTQKRKTVFAVSENYERFYLALLQKVKSEWNRSGNSIIGLSDSKVSRLFNGQKDFETLLKMAEFMQIEIEFSAKQ